MVSEDEAKEAPATFETKPAVGKSLAGYEYRIQVSSLDCMGCGSCVEICPAKEKALVMKPLEEQTEQVRTGITP